ncbi:VRR-NUC domain-containing protein [Fodinicurvata sp. EGI_FJ10296]|uniref:VRR-NUC domain-containing protein n=1 Tax=Fodinicurvata sp. EGI_FJ10296 TaxID=3231908 RepID=UPI003455F5F7
MAAAVQTAIAPWLVRLMTVAAYTGHRAGPEDREAIALANRLRAWTLEGRLQAVWWHTASEVGGGGKNAGLRYALAKAMGLTPGSPDYVFLTDAGAYAIELKATNGRQTDSQRDFQSWCAARGIPYAVCKGADAAETQLRAWGVVA